MEKLIKTIYQYNIDIFFFYFFLSFFLISNISNVENKTSSLQILSANSLLLLATYILNKVSDKNEDLLNETLPVKNSKKNYVLIFILYSFSFVFYLLQQELILLLYWVLLFILGVLYSFPKEKRLKNIFLIKNIVPSFSWYFSICVMFFSGFKNAEILKIMFELLPYFLIFFIIEILWDLPDMRGDKENGITTIPLLIGFEKTKIVLSALLSLVIIFNSSIQTKILSIIILIFILFITPKLKKITYQLFLSFLLLIKIIMHFSLS